MRKGINIYSPATFGIQRNKPNLKHLAIQYFVVAQFKILDHSTSGGGICSDVRYNTHLYCLDVGCLKLLLYEHCSEKTGLRGFRQGPTQTGLYSHRRWLEA